MSVCVQRRSGAMMGACYVSDIVHVIGHSACHISMVRVMHVMY